MVLCFVFFLWFCVLYFFGVIYSVFFLFFMCTNSDIELMNGPGVLGFQPGSLRINLAYDLGEIGVGGVCGELVFVLELNETFLCLGTGASVIVAISIAVTCVCVRRLSDSCAMDAMRLIASSTSVCRNPRTETIGSLLLELMSFAQVQVSCWSFLRVFALVPKTMPTSRGWTEIWRSMAFMERGRKWLMIGIVATLGRVCSARAATSLMR